MTTTTAPLAVSIRTAADMLDMSENVLRAAITDGKLPARRNGRAIRIETAELTTWFRSLPAVTEADA